VLLACTFKSKGYEVLLPGIEVVAADIHTLAKGAEQQVCWFVGLVVVLLGLCAVEEV
jgi:hypothetical protein